MVSDHGQTCSDNEAGHGRPCSERVCYMEHTVKTWSYHGHWPSNGMRSKHGQIIVTNEWSERGQNMVADTEDVEHGQNIVTDSWSEHDQNMFRDMR